jgi:6-phosphofructokinase 1
MSIAIMCSGGDACGMNPAIKSFVDNCYEKEITPYFIYDGFEGLINGNIKKAFHEDVAGIMHLGGTIIRTSRSKRFYDKEYRKVAYKNLQKFAIDKVILLGGDGSFKGFNQFSQEFGISFIGIPSTIDNDIYGTDYCLGVDTSLNIIKHALDEIRDTSASFKRAFVVETMGRECGYLALISTIISGAEVCIIPELDYNLDSLQERLKKELDNGRAYILAVVAEGTKQTQHIKLWLEEKLEIETRVMILGHIQRGGNPSVFDRLMAAEFVILSLDKLIEDNNTRSVIAYKDAEFIFIDIDTVTQNSYSINPKHLKMVTRLTR